MDGIDAIWTLNCYPDMPRCPVGTHLKISGDSEIWMPQPVDGHDWAPLLKAPSPFRSAVDSDPSVTEVLVHPVNIEGGRNGTTPL